MRPTVLGGQLGVAHSAVVHDQPVHKVDEGRSLFEKNPAFKTRMSFVSQFTI